MTSPSMRPTRSLALADYLAAVHEFMTRYVAFPSEHEPVAIALWVAHAHVVEEFETSPILSITSAEMRSGKTRTLDCLEVLVPNPFRVVIPSEAVVYTVLSQRPRPTLLLDEADAIFGPRTAERYEGVRAVLNSGNRVGTPVLRVKLEGKRREVEAFDVFGPKAVAGIGELPSTVADRSIPIRLKRRAPGETVGRFRRRVAEAEALAIRFEPAKYAFNVEDVDVPGELPDRAANSWETLLAIAEEAGGSWPMLGRLAAIALSSDDEAPVSIGMRLLADIRDCFGDLDHLSTHDLLGALRSIDDAPWGDWYGCPAVGSRPRQAARPVSRHARQATDRRHATARLLRVRLRGRLAAIRAAGFPCTRPKCPKRPGRGRWDRWDGWDECRGRQTAS